VLAPCPTADRVCGCLLGVAMPIRPIIPTYLIDLIGWVRRVVGTIWNVGSGDQSSLPVRNANSGNPLRLTPPLTR